MNDERKNTWDVRFGIIAPVLTILGIVIGVWQFNTGERNKTILEYSLIEKRDTVDFKRKLWLERVSAYKNISDLAGQIVSNPKTDKTYDDLVQKFYSSYWGVMILVEDRDVEKQMIAFHLAALDYKNRRITSDELKQHADLLLSACKNSLKGGSFE